jgi:hypothetical protein
VLVKLNGSTRETKQKGTHGGYIAPIRRSMFLRSIEEHRQPFEHFISPSGGLWDLDRVGNHSTESILQRVVEGIVYKLARKVGRRMSGRRSRGRIKVAMKMVIHQDASKVRVGVVEEKRKEYSRLLRQSLI